jgi:uncharacterized protein YndB with AHSA1/START domain
MVMGASDISRRGFTFATAAAGAGGVALSSTATRTAAADETGISRDHAAIHQETVFKASPHKVYGVLTEAKAFDRVVMLSGALQAMHLAASRCRIGKTPGSSFALFGGFITGRHLELQPGVRLIQTWRSAGWPEHIHSIARFELRPHDDGTLLVFDHTGFPDAEAASLASGWREHYWNPMAKVLA